MYARTTVQLAQSKESFSLSSKNIYIIFFTHDRLDDGSIVFHFPAGATISSLLQNVQACTIQWEPEGIFLRES